MNKKAVGTVRSKTKKAEGQEIQTYKRPKWVPSGEDELCPDCFKVVGDRNRYKIVCMLGKKQKGMNVTELTKELNLTQPTVTHHLNALRSVDAVASTDVGRARIYTLNRDAHCFEECMIPF